MMVRRAAAGRVAAAGDAAIAAVRAFEQRHGRNAIGLELITAYGGSETGAAATHALLEEWARDREFYWRSQALGALAQRRLPAYRALFLAHLDDLAHLTRIQAGRGLCRLGVDGDRVRALLRDADPRTRLRVAECLIEAGDDRGLPTLVEALRQDGAFLDYPWGRLGANVAAKLLKRLAGADFGFAPGASPEQNAAAIKRFDAWARGRLGEKWVDPVPASRDASTYRGGIEIRSCRNGDVYLRWTAAGQLACGLEGSLRLPLPAEVFALLDGGPPKSDQSRHGKVVCDFIRLVCPTPGIDQKSAPRSLPAASTRWLEAVAAGMRPDLAALITGRLEQFRQAQPK